MILNSSSWSKTTLVFLRNKYGFQIGNAISSVLKRINAHNGLIPTHKEIFGFANSNGIYFEAVHLDVSELWSVFMHYFGNGSS